MQFLAAFIMRGRMQAVMVLSLLALVALAFFPVNIVSSATVALVTLRLGAREGFYVLASGAVAAMLVATLLLNSMQPAVLYGVPLVSLWLAIWIIAIVLREGRRLALAIEFAVVLGATGVFVLYVFHPDPAQIWREVLSVVIQFMQQVQPDFGSTIDQEAMARVMTGNLIASLVSGLLLGLFLARWWQAILFNPGGFGAEFLAIKGHSQLAVLTILLFAGALFASGWFGELCKNVVSVLLVLYVFIGVAILHCVVSAMPGRAYLLPLFYVMLLFARPLLGIVVLCGLTDNWLDLRNKFKPKGA